MSFPHHAFLTHAFGCIPPKLRISSPEFHGVKMNQNKFYPLCSFLFVLIYDIQLQKKYSKKNKKFSLFRRIFYEEIQPTNVCIITGVNKITAYIIVDIIMPHIPLPAKSLLPTLPARARKAEIMKTIIENG